MKGMSASAEHPAVGGAWRPMPPLQLSPCPFERAVLLDDKCAAGRPSSMAAPGCRGATTVHAGGKAT